MENIELSEKRNGFSHRDMHSKAILNSDQSNLLKYKIQRNKMARLSATTVDMENMREEVNTLREELKEIKSLLLQITVGSKCQ
jgi:hypothetical protein